MQAEIIAIGDELTSGQRLDTNSQWLASELGKLGVRVSYHTTVGDRLSDNIDAFRIAARRCQLVISTGGLGPTADDLTRDAISAAFESPLELRTEALEHIERLFAHRKRPMPERNRIQAMFPQTSRIIDNRFGTAPGIDFTVRADDTHSSRIFALPGVPSEMFEMYMVVVRLRMIEEMGLGKQQWFFKNLRLFGIGESDVESYIPDLIARQREPLVGITVSQATINLRIATLASSQEEANLKWQSTVDEIEQHLGSYIFGSDEDEPWDAVVRLLTKRQQTISIVEYGFASVLGPRLAGAAASADISSTVASVHWSSTKPNIEQYQNESDFLMVLGPYPYISDSEPKRGVFSIEIYQREKEVFSNRLPIAGHPNIILQRLAKSAAKSFLDLK